MLFVLATSASAFAFDERPTLPTLCTWANAGRCDCANLYPPGSRLAVFAKTYTWFQGDEQRCLTTYVPQPRENTTLVEDDKTLSGAPTVLYLQCYGRDKMQVVLRLKPRAALVVHPSVPWMPGVFARRRASRVPPLTPLIASASSSSTCPRRTAPGRGTRPSSPMPSRARARRTPAARTIPTSARASAPNRPARGGGGMHVACAVASDALFFSAPSHLV